MQPERCAPSKIYMKQYIVAEFAVADESWIAEYMADVSGLVDEYGGRFLARTTHVQRLEGDRETPQWMFIIEFPSPEAAANWYTCAEYQPYLEKSTSDSFSNVVGIPGEDLVVR
jgi:uncharacterized protein (DUF1330 family)